MFRQQRLRLAMSKSAVNIDMAREEREYDSSAQKLNEHTSEIPWDNDIRRLCNDTGTRVTENGWGSKVGVVGDLERSAIAIDEMHSQLGGVESFGTVDIRGSGGNRHVQSPSEGGSVGVSWKRWKWRSTARSMATNGCGRSDGKSHSGHLG